MSFRINPLWWPVMVLLSPILVPVLAGKNKKYRQNLELTQKRNQERIDQAQPMDLPAVDQLDLTVLVEEKTEDGFIGDAGVSYLFRTEQGALLYDVGFGPSRPALAHNAAKLNIDPGQIDAFCISHLHPDHMGGMKASSSKQVMVPPEIMPPESRTCFLPDQAGTKGFDARVVTSPQDLTAGIATTGPLARSLFFLGLTEEQALVIRLKDKGLAVFTGCGHPTIEVIIKMVRRMSDEPIYALGGGLHFPVTCGRGNRLGIQFQQFIGTGKPPWQKIEEDDLSRTISAINEAAPQKVFLSAHDTCDHALGRFEKELNAETTVLHAGRTYEI
jgi:7,8-dihydropterin-6-yl-methyl-4-(beta-D-ribofuranosyl)aminobenzene 5'-phosphate synthase